MTDPTNPNTLSHSYTALTSPVEVLSLPLVSVDIDLAVTPPSC